MISDIRIILLICYYLYLLVTINNSIKLFYKGKDKFDALIADLNNAKQFIHMEYFIWRNDPLTEQVKDILINKSRQGVEV